MTCSGHLLLASADGSAIYTLTAIVILAIGSQWLAWRLRVPSILFLLCAGFVAGLSGLLNPDQLVSPDLLFAFVSLSVALILFEGGLTLDFRELQTSGGVIRNLCSVGALVTAILATAAARLLLDMGIGTALIFGSMLVVTGPTVVGPLLRHIRPTGRCGTIAKWEGIVIDPVGAMLGVLALASVEAIELHGTGGAAQAVIVGLLKTVFWGGFFGLLGALPTAYLLRRYWIPDHLQVPVLLMVVLASFTAANALQPESGLFAVTLMGVVLVNQRNLSLDHIIEFKENLRVLLISLLFILLAARIQFDTFTQLGWGSVAFVATLMVIVRPVAVFISTIGMGLSWQERVFLAWLAPRGIVAAALASIFALALEALQADNDRALSLLNPGDADKLVPETFLVIVVTVAVYGLTAGPLAQRLKLALPNPQGLLIASAHAGARALAGAVQKAGFSVLLVDTNRDNVRIARMEGLPAYFASILSEHALEELDLGGLGRLLAMTRNDEVNALASLHFSEVFGSAEVYQLVPSSEKTSRTETSTTVIRGRRLFAASATYNNLDHRFASGAAVKTTRLTSEFNFEAFRTLYGETALLLFVVTENGSLNVNSVDQPLAPKPGETLIALVEPREEEADEGAATPV